MPEFLYTFGYETPRQRVNNPSFYWDDENSKCILVTADSEQEAQEWGDQIARRYSELLHGEDLYPAENPAGCVEHRLNDLDLSGCPRLRVGEYPRLEDWLVDDRNS